jgi:hypothetical protein
MVGVTLKGENRIEIIISGNESTENLVPGTVTYVLERDVVVEMTIYGDNNQKMVVTNPKIIEKLCRSFLKFCNRRIIKL